MSIVTEIERIQNAKASIKTAIENKGVVVGDGTIDTYASKIDEITTGGSDVEINDCSYLFCYGARINQANDILKLCKNVTDTSNMFYNCPNVMLVDLSNFDTSNVTNMLSMFDNNYYLKELDLSNFDTSNVTNMAYMFRRCRAIKTLDLNNFDASKVNTLYGFLMFCESLEKLIFIKNLGKGYSRKSSNYDHYGVFISQSTNLTHESLMDIINKLYDLNLTYDVANGGTLYTQQLVIGSDNVAKLTSEEINIAVSKGWVVS